MAKQDKMKRLHAQRDEAVITRDEQAVELARLRRERDDLTQALREDHQKLCIEETLRQKAERDRDEYKWQVSAILGWYRNLLAIDEADLEKARESTRAPEVAAIIRKLNAKPKCQKVLKVVPNPELMKALEVLGPKVKHGGPARRGTCGVCGNPLHGGRCFDCEGQGV